MSSRKFFGTDGIRGYVGVGSLHPEQILKLGWAIGKALRAEQEGRLSNKFSKGKIKVLLGKDTRVSGYLVESALEAGLAAAGTQVLLLGPLPTPAIAYLTESLRASAGIVISASHNPFHDNGIKVFSAGGMKISDEFENLIESYMSQPMECVAARDVGKAARINDAGGRYVQFCKATFPAEGDLSKLKIVLDCANGATYKVAPAVFNELNAEVVTIGASPDGYNINADVGSTHPKLLQDIVLATNADVGLAFDGDGDRLIMVDHTGRLIDGDDILFVLSHIESICNPEKGVVGTLMTNLALEQYFKARNIPFTRTEVGDRYVLAELKKHNWLLGGETSGHVLNLGHTTTGDGIVTGLQVLAVMCATGLSLHDLCKDFIKKPQVLINVPIVRKINLLDYPDIAISCAEIEAELFGSGRVLLRVSGTELCVRVMVEAETEESATKYAEMLAAVIKKICAEVVTTN
jgi:phosphoglucosamine mutase